MRTDNIFTQISAVNLTILQLWSIYKSDGLFVDADFALSRAKFRDSDVAGKHIPGSINKTASFSVTAGHEFGWYGSACFRYFGPRSLIEDNSQISDSTFITNARAGYRVNKRLNVTMDVLSAFDSNSHDIDYFYASRLQGETAEGVEDFHNHPVVPRTFRLSVQYTYWGLIKKIF